MSLNPASLLVPDIDPLDPDAAPPVADVEPWPGDGLEGDGVAPAGRVEALSHAEHIAGGAEEQPGILLLEFKEVEFI